MHMPSPRRTQINPRPFGRLCGLPLWVVLAAGAVLTGCSANEASGPMKPSPASASKPLLPGTGPKPAAAAKPASTATTTSTPVPSSARRDVQAASKPASSSVRTPAASSTATAASAQPRVASAPTAKPAATAITKTETPTPPTQTTAAPKALEPRPAPTASAVSTADFSTGLLFPDPDPATAAARTISLCEFKNGEWTPIMTAPVQTYGGDARGVTFRAVPVGRMVLPAYIVGDEVLPAANPWAVESSGKVRELKGPCATCPGNEPPILTLELRPAPVDAANQRMTIEPGEYGVMVVRAESSRRYTLSYWDDAWKPIGEATVSGDGPVRIEGIPSRRVLWLQSEGENLTLPVLP